MITIKEQRGEIKKAYGGDVELVRIIQHEGEPFLVLIDLLKNAYHFHYNQKSRSINSQNLKKYIKKGKVKKIDILSESRGYQSTLCINDIALIEVIAGYYNLKVLNNEEIEDLKKRGAVNEID